MTFVIKPIALPLRKAFAEIPTPTDPTIISVNKAEFRNFERTLFKGTYQKWMQDKAF